MKLDQKFMMIFSYSPNPGYVPTEQEMTQMKEDWGSFIGNIAIKEKLDSTNQLGFEGNQIAADSSISKGFSLAENKMISGYMIVKANSLEEATEMAKDCPILAMGGTVEIRNIIPMEH